LASPEYTVVIASVPPTSWVVAQAAVREEDTAIAEQPEIAVPLERNTTVPVGVGGPTGLIVAVSVTGWPAVEGFKLDTTAVAEAAWFTICDNAALVLVR
jgi:hypothetical protein